MDRVLDRVLDRLDATLFLQIWQHFDVHDQGHLERQDLEEFFRHMLQKLGLKREEVTEQRVEILREKVLSAFDPKDDQLQIQEVAALLLPEDENFLLLFRRETPLNNSVEFMRIWRNYDQDSSGFISALELKGFLQDLFVQHRKSISADKLDQYTVSMMKMFDKNRDGRLDLEELARILAMKENFLLRFQMDSGTGALEGPEVDGFVKDMMELVKPSISGLELDGFRKLLLNHCDLNRDGKIQKNELALCLGIKLS